MTTNIDPSDTQAVLAHARDTIARIEESRSSQPARLIEAREHADEACEAALAEEPWDEMWFAMPGQNGAGELTGMLALPTMDGKALFGTRLAFDLLGRCPNEEQVSDTLSQYFAMIKDPAHMFLVAFEALETIANYIVPSMLETLEQQASDYDSRVRLADAARNAWAARVNDLRSAGGESDDADGADA